MKAFYLSHIWLILRCDGIERQFNETGIRISYIRYLCIFIGSHFAAFSMNDCWDPLKYLYFGHHLREHWQYLVSSVTSVFRVEFSIHLCSGLFYSLDFKPRDPFCSRQFYLLYIFKFSKLFNSWYLFLSYYILFNLKLWALHIGNSALCSILFYFRHILIELGDERVKLISVLYFII